RLRIQDDRLTVDAGGVSTATRAIATRAESARPPSGSRRCPAGSLPASAERGCRNVVPDCAQDFPEFAWFFVLGQMRRFIEPDKLLASRRVQPLVVPLRTTGGSDVIVPSLHQEHRDIQAWQQRKQVEAGKIRQQVILRE